jgi:hypothetical protein
MKNIEKALSSIDWQLLAKQKQELLSKITQDQTEPSAIVVDDFDGYTKVRKLKPMSSGDKLYLALSPEGQALLNGLLHLLDAIQDAAVADGLAEEAAVFPGIDDN